MNNLHSNTYKTNICEQEESLNFLFCFIFEKKIKTYFVFPDILALAVP